MDKTKLKQIAQKLYLNINDKVASQLEEEYDILAKEIEMIQKIDTTNIKPMFRVDETRISFMREDIKQHVLSKKTIINNFPQVVEDFVAIKRVINND